MINTNLKKNNTGFSVVELSGMLAIIAILAALAVPMLTSSMRSMQLISDARSIATTMSNAKLSAISQMTKYRLNFRISENEWSLEKYNRDTSLWETLQGINGLSSGAATSEIAFKPTSSVGAPAETGFNATSSQTITFNTQGLPDEGDSIVYISNNDLDYAVSVSVSGKIQIWRYQNNQWQRQ